MKAGRKEGTRGGDRGEEVEGRKEGTKGGDRGEEVEGRNWMSSLHSEFGCREPMKG